MSIGIVGAIGVDEDADRCCDVGDREAQSDPLTGALVSHDLRAGLFRDFRRAVRRTAFDDDNVGGIATTFPNHLRDGRRLVARRNDGGDIRVRRRQMIRKIARDELALPHQPGGTKQHELPLVIAESDGLH